MAFPGKRFMKSHCMPTLLQVTFKPVNWFQSNLRGLTPSKIALHSSPFGSSTAESSGLVSSDRENSAAVYSPRSQHKHLYAYMSTCRHKHTLLVTDLSAYAELWASYFLPCGLPWNDMWEQEAGNGSTQLSVCCLLGAAGIADTHARAERHCADMHSLQGALGRFSKIQGEKKQSVRYRCYCTSFSYLLKHSQSFCCLQGSHLALPYTWRSLSVPPIGFPGMSVSKEKADIVNCILNTSAFAKMLSWLLSTWSIFNNNVNKHNLFLIQSWGEEIV